MQRCFIHDDLGPRVALQTMLGIVDLADWDCPAHW
jgi:hypothetical protein